MLVAQLPDNEQERLRRLNELGILDTLAEQAYDDLTSLAAQICSAPIALITLIDDKRQWFKSQHGLDVKETPRNVSFCSHAILNDELFIVEDAEQDERFKDNPLVTQNLGLKFYAGAPLVLDKNIRLGTICVIDRKKRSLSGAQQSALQALARQVIALLELRLKVKELKKMDLVKDEFLSMVSHELRTPLTSLKGSLKIMSHLKQGVQKDSMLDIAERNAEQLLILVNDILDLAKMEAGDLSMELAPLNLTKLLKTTLEMNQGYVAQCHCRLLLNIPDNAEGLLVNGDETRLIQVISNLISNAAKFSPNGGKVELGVEKIGKLVKVSVTDYGEGIPKKFQKHIFTKFRQLGKNQNQKLPGTGLGLNICKHIIDAHGGEIGFTSEANDKTVFYFKLDLLNLY